MNTIPRFRLALLVLLVVASPLAAQHGPGAPAQAEGLRSIDPDAPPAEGPVAEIPTLDTTTESPLRDEALIPLGARTISEVLPKLSGQGEPDAEQVAEPESKSRFGDIIRTSGALLLVIALILAMAWVVKRLARKQSGIGAKLSAGGRSPSGLLEVLGRYPVGGKLSLVVLRFDRRVLLIAQGHGASAGMSTLCELDDPSDVASVLSKVGDADKINSAFKEAIAHAERDVATALSPETHVPIARFDPGSRQVTQSQDGDRLELLSDGGGFGSPQASVEISPLRRRLDALRAGVGV